MAQATRSSLTVLDTAQFGERGTGCAYLLRSEKTAVIDTGTAASAPRLLEALRGMVIDYAFLTHVHLDHAGGAGHLVAAHPETTVVVHPRGLPHLADPERLISGMRTASPDLAPLYGEPRPIDRQRLAACADGDVFPLGRECRLVAVETPGHAPHHVSYFEPETGVFFVGDAVGHHRTPVDLPLTVPPRFDREAARRSIRRMLDLHPTALAFAHFGLADRAKGLLESYPDRVDEWLARVAGLREGLPDDEAVADTILADSRFSTLSDVGKNALRLCVCGAILTLDAENSRPQTEPPS